MTKTHGEINECGCCHRYVPLPYRSHRHGYDYCQDCSDNDCTHLGCNLKLIAPGDGLIKPLTPTTPEGGAVSNPITPQMLREDWKDNPDLTQTQKDLLATYGTEALQKALDGALRDSRNQNAWYDLLDEVRSSATQTLIANLPDPNNADEGSDDECLQCGLPITMKGGTWADSFFGSPACGEGGSHAPKDLTQQLKTLLRQGPHAGAAAADRSGTSTDGSVKDLFLVTLTTEGGDREDGNVYYADHLVFLHDPNLVTNAMADLASLLGGTVNGNQVSFREGASSAADDLHNDTNALCAKLLTLGWTAHPIHNIHVISDHS